MIYVYFSELSSKMWKMIFHLCSKRIISHVEADRGRKFQQTWFYAGLPTETGYWTLKNNIQRWSKFNFTFLASYPGLLVLIRVFLELATLKSIRSHKCTTFEFDESCYYARPTNHFSFIMSLLSFEILHHILLLLSTDSFL